MEKNNVFELASQEEVLDPLTDLLQSGARQLIKQAVEAEVEELLSQYSTQRTKDGNAGVVRNGYLPERQLQTGIGPVTVRIPKVRSRTGKPVTFSSALVPPYVRKTKSLEAALPWLYLKGVSSGEMGEALKVLVGPQAEGLSASTVSRLKQTWAQEYHCWNDERLDKERWVYVWADGVYSGLRGETEKLCALVIIGVNERGQKQFLAIEDGVRESTQSWREVLLKLKSRGMNGPQLAIGDGAMGFWAALEEVYPKHTPAALLDAQDDECAQLPAQVIPAKSLNNRFIISGRQRPEKMRKRPLTCSLKYTSPNIQRQRYVCTKIAPN